MSEVKLAHKYSGETYKKSLSNLVKRWEQVDGEKPVKYGEAAIGMDETTVSTCLRFLAEIGLLESPKAGRYNVPKEVVEYENRLGDVKKEAKRKVEKRLNDYSLYDEAKFYIGVDSFTIEDLSKELAGSTRIAASEDELSDVKRSVNILVALGFLEIDDDGIVSCSPDLFDPSEDNSQREEKVSSEMDNVDQNGSQNSNTIGVEQSTPAEEVHNGNKHKNQQMAVSENSSSPSSKTQLVVDIDITMDITEMDTKEIEDRLEVINEYFDHK